MEPVDNGRNEFRVGTGGERPLRGRDKRNSERSSNFMRKKSLKNRTALRGRYD